MSWEIRYLPEVLEDFRAGYDAWRTSLLSL